MWGCVSYDCKLDLITVRGNRNGQIYRQNILEASVVPHFDNHPLNTMSVFMDDNARPHRARVVRPIMSQMCSIRFKSGLLAGHGSVVIDSPRK
jgi:hypothetical protein